MTFEMKLWSVVLGIKASSSRMERMPPFALIKLTMSELSWYWMSMPTFIPSASYSCAQQPLASQAAILLQLHAKEMLIEVTLQDLVAQIDKELPPHLRNIEKASERLQAVMFEAFEAGDIQDAQEDLP